MCEKSKSESEDSHLPPQEERITCSPNLWAVSSQRPVVRMQPYSSLWKIAFYLWLFYNQIYIIIRFICDHDLIYLWSWSDIFVIVVRFICDHDQIYFWLSWQCTPDMHPLLWSRWVGSNWSQSSHNLRPNHSLFCWKFRFFYIFVVKKKLYILYFYETCFRGEQNPEQQIRYLLSLPKDNYDNHHGLSLTNDGHDDNHNILWKIYIFNNHKHENDTNHDGLSLQNNNHDGLSW